MKVYTLTFDGEVSFADGMRIAVIRNTGNPPWTDVFLWKPDGVEVDYQVDEEARVLGDWIFQYNGVTYLLQIGIKVEKS